MVSIQYNAVLIVSHSRKGDEILVVPEDTQAEAPPSYASAQADSVPPYWETTVHAPFSPDSMGELMIDALPTGSLFSFLCNMLVSISFQFIGFLLTYLLHTTHAARLGSRAGLGVTLIQYGFALRGRLDDVSDGEGGWGQWRSDSANATWPSAPDADSIFNNATSPTDSPYPGLTEEQAGQLVADATTEWLSFFLMTVGQFHRRLALLQSLNFCNRLVCVTNIPTWLLACQAVGAQYHGDPTDYSRRHTRRSRFTARHDSV